MSNISRLTTLASAGAGAAGWDLTLASADPAPNPYDIYSTWYIQFRGINELQDYPTALFIKPDGDKMYVGDRGFGELHEYDLSTAWNVQSETYVGKVSFNNPTGIFFKPDGTKLFNCTNNGDKVEEYALSTAWDITTASLTASYSVSSQSTEPHGLHMSPDGTKMYHCGLNDQEVYEYTLSTAWDITTASYVQTAAVSYQGLQDIGFNPDGTYMYVLRVWNGLRAIVYQFSLSTAWDISTATLFRSASPGTQNQEGYALTMGPDGTLFYTTSYTGGNKYVSANQMGYAYGWNGTNMTGMTVSPDGTGLFTVDLTLKNLYEFRLATSFDIASVINTLTSKVQYNARGLSGEDSAPRGIEFKPDGTKMYICGDTGNFVIEYNLSTPFDISTSTFSTNIIVTSYTTQPHSVRFKPDGTKMYVISGSANGAILEYALSTAWDLSTATYNQQFLSGREYSVRDVAFKPDGTKMFILGNAGDLSGPNPSGKFVHEYDLSTAWDITTGSFVTSFSYEGTALTGENMSFSEDGDKFFINSTRGIYSFSISN